MTNANHQDKIQVVPPKGKRPSDHDSKNSLYGDVVEHILLFLLGGDVFDSFKSPRYGVIKDTLNRMSFDELVLLAKRIDDSSAYLHVARLFPMLASFYKYIVDNSYSTYGFVVNESENGRYSFVYQNEYYSEDFENESDAYFHGWKISGTPVADLIVSQNLSKNKKCKTDFFNKTR